MDSLAIVEAPESRALSVRKGTGEAGRGGITASAVASLPFPWRDPKSVDKEELAACIVRLKAACLAEPTSAPLRTCLGIAHAMNYDVYASMHSLEVARELDPTSFWAQMKFAELLYRLRALPRAEEETVKALELAEESLEMAVARRQLGEIRRMIREGTQKPAWTKPLGKPAMILGVAAAMAIVWTAVQL
jgi:hypothetical protein